MVTLKYTNNLIRTIKRDSHILCWTIYRVSTNLTGRRFTCFDKIVLGTINYCCHKYLHVSIHEWKQNPRLILYYNISFTALAISFQLFIITSFFFFSSWVYMTLHHHKFKLNIFDKTRS